MLFLWKWSAYILFTIGLCLGYWRHDLKIDREALKKEAQMRSVIADAGEILEWFSRLDKKPSNVGTKIFAEYQNKASAILTKRRMVMIMRSERKARAAKQTVEAE
jgi:hypothetical protein